MATQPDPREPTPDLGGDWRVYQNLLTQRDALQRNIAELERQHPEWIVAPAGNGADNRP